MSEIKTPKLNLVAMRKTQLPTLEFILPGLLRGSVGLMTGPGGVGKSYITFLFAISVASGHVLSVHSDYDGVTTIPRRVLWLTAEDPAEILHHRLMSIDNMLLSRHQHDSSIDSLIDSALERIALRPTLGRDFSLIEFDGQPTDCLQELHAMIKEDKPDLIFIDTLRQYHSSDENDNARMSSIIQHFKKIAMGYNCSIVLVHHENKAGLNNSDANQSAVRGASAIVDNARWLVRLRAMSSNESKTHFDDENHKLRSEYVCLETGVKSNFGPINGGLWFKKTMGGALEQTDLSVIKNNNKNWGRRNGTKV